MKVASHKSIGEERKSTGLVAAPCLNCGRIFILSANKGAEVCKCGYELHSAVGDVYENSELLLPDGVTARVGQDQLLRAAAPVIHALINQTTCDCAKGVQCYHCQAIVLLRAFPGPEEGSLEDDWATLRGRPKKDAPVRTITDEERGWYQRLVEDEL